MTVDPFIEAEEAAGHGAKRACRLLEVSRSAYYERKKAIPSARDVTDAELTERIKEVHDESKGTYGYLRVRKALADEGTCVGKWRVRRLMRAAGLEGRAKKRWRTTTVPDPAAEAAKDLIQRHFGPCEELDRRTSATSPTSRPGRAGLTWPRSSTSPAARWWAGLLPITCAPNWSKRPSRWPSSSVGRPRE
jgi:transposase InsO family protein